MASSSSSSAPSVPISIPLGGYDVFISFRGKDTRNSFTSHLHAALCGKDILSFIDSKHPKAGDHISDSLQQAIVQSKLYIVVFSPNYASSKWCLLELVKILYEKRVNGKMVMPVFYGVDPWVIRYHTKSFREAFIKHERRHGIQTVKIWREALVEATDLSGWDSSAIRPESKLIKKIVDDVLEKLKWIHSVQLNDSVEIESCTEEVVPLLRGESVSKDVNVKWGMGGIGKTRDARSVFLSIHTQFQASSCFPQNIREQLKMDGSVSLWNNFLQATLGEETVALLSVVIILCRRFERNCNWKNPLVTIIFHIYLVIFVFFPTGFDLPIIFCIFLGLIMKLLRRQRDTSRGHFDTRLYYYHIRNVAGTVQTVVGYLETKGKRLTSIIKLRDPRATLLFVAYCSIAFSVISVIPKQVLVLLIGLYRLRHPRFRHNLPSAHFGGYQLQDLTPLDKPSSI